MDAGDVSHEGLETTVYRAEYLHVIEMARATNDPCDDWDAFAEELWSGLVSAFGLDVEVLDASQHDQRLHGLVEGRPE